MSASSKDRFPFICGLVVVLVSGGCSASSPDEAFSCLNDGDCPPGCSCENDFTVTGVCESDSNSNDCGGSCDAETQCPAGTSCVFDRSEGEVDLYACKGPPGMDGDLGASCQSNDDCDPEASSLGAFCCLDSSLCGSNLNQCVEDCSMYSSGGGVGSDEGADCQDNSQCGNELFCCLVPDAAGNCDFEQDQSCTCRSTGGGMTGEQRCFGDTAGDGTFDSCCISDTDCESQRCCTGPDICGFDEELDNRFTCRNP